MECERDYIVSFILKSVFLEFDMISLGEWVMGFMNATIYRVLEEKIHCSTLHPAGLSEHLSEALLNRLNRGIWMGSVRRLTKKQLKPKCHFEV